MEALLYTGKQGNINIEHVKTVEYQDFDYTELEKYIKDLNEIRKDCILKVDLEYASALRDKHNDFSFCPQNTREYEQKVSKLKNTLFNKGKYVIHYKNLIQALDDRLKLRKVHRILHLRKLIR